MPGAIGARRDARGRRAPARAAEVPHGVSRAPRVAVALLLLAGWPGVAAAETLGEVFKRVNPAVVIVRTVEREAAAGGGLATVPGAGGFEGLGFVVTSNMARRLLLEERAFWTGLQGFYVEGALARALNLPQDAGLLVQRVAERSTGARCSSAAT